jgi:phytoene dehydrogenase-like protein
MSRPFDLIVLGAGHNGLVTAAYAARAGRRVLVLERRPIVGGACVTEEIWPGFRVSVAAYVNSLFRPEIVRDLRLAEFGFRVLKRDPSSFTPFRDGRHLLLGPDKDLCRREIGKFSTRDADAFPRYEAMLDRLAGALEPAALRPPPDLGSGRWGDLLEAARTLWRVWRLGTDARHLACVLTGSARELLDRWFESEELKVTLATDGVIGVFAPPSAPGTAYNLYHHCSGQVDGVRGVWGYVQGGMGSLTQALASAARRYGAEIRTDAEVARILVRGGQCAGVVLADGTEIPATRVASNATAPVTFLKLVGEKELPADFAAAVRRADHSSASVKINVALADVPQFRCLPGDGPGPQHRGTIHISPSFDYLERAYEDARAGRPAAAPMIECGLPSVVDPTVAPPGRHLMSMFVQYAPYTLAEGTWDDHREAFADRVFAVMEEYAPGFRSLVIDRQVLAPPDIEARFGLTGGNIFQGAMLPPQLFADRPVTGWAGYRTPVRGLYLCGAAAHPGGGVLGAPGYNAARAILSDRWE